MQVVADVKCYHCGHSSGELVGLRGTPVKDWTFEGPAGERLSEGQKVRCLRCSGPVYLEDVRSFRADDPVRALKRRMAQARLAGAA